MPVTSHKRISEYTIKEATLDDAESIGLRLRWSDIQEIYATSGRVPHIAIKEAFLRSDMCWTGFIDDLPIAMFGCAAPSVMATIASPWMLGTDELDSAAIGIGRASLYYVQKMSERFDYLENYIDARQKKSIRWLKWCGFTIEEAEPKGRHGEMLHKFWRKKYV